MTAGRHGDDNDPRLLTGAYALDAVTAEEAEAFDRAAADAPSLRDEADELRLTAGLLGLASTPVEPSARMKSDLMAKLSSTPQLPRQTPTAVPDAPAASTIPVADAPLAAVPDAPAEPTTLTEVAPTAAAPTAAAPTKAEQRAKARWFARPTTLLTAVAAAAALFIGGGFVGSALVNGTGGEPVADASASELAQITAADDVQRQVSPVEGGGTATLVWSNELGRSAVLADGLPSLPDGKVYEAWYIDSEGAAPAGTFTAAGSGTSWHVLDGAMSPGDAVGVTVEPAGGSKAPTTDPIIVVQSA